MSTFFSVLWPLLEILKIFGNKNAIKRPKNAISAPLPPQILSGRIWQNLKPNLAESEKNRLAALPCGQHLRPFLKSFKVIQIAKNSRIFKAPIVSLRLEQGCHMAEFSAKFARFGRIWELLAVRKIFGQIAEFENWWPKVAEFQDFGLFWGENGRI